MHRRASCALAGKPSQSNYQAKQAARITEYASDQNKQQSNRPIIILFLYSTLSLFFSLAFSFVML